MNDRRDLVWYEIDRLRREADKLERTVRRHDDCDLIVKLEKLVDAYLGSFCIGMIIGMLVCWLRWKL